MKLVRLDTNEEVKMYAVEVPKSDDGLWFAEEVTINRFPAKFIHATIHGPYYFKWEDQWFCVPRPLNDKDLYARGLEFKIVEVNQ